jgi:predicted component of type VI protein secretion system
MRLRLVVLTPGKMQGKALPISLNQFLIGRDPHCHLRPASPVISNRHCALLVRGNKAFVRDFESTNGTFVNDQPVKGQQELYHQDILRVGPVVFRVEVEATRAVSVSQSAPTTAGPPRVDAVDDETMAALLLAVPDEGDLAPGSLPLDSEGIPTGSTVMDMPVPVPAEPEAAPRKTTAKKPPVPQPADNTSAVANSLVQKYLRRSRK